MTNQPELFHAVCYDDTEQIPVSLSVLLPESDDSVVTGEILFPNFESRKIIQRENKRGNYYYKIKATDHVHKSIWIPKLYITDHKNMLNASGFAPLYVEGNLDNFTETDDDGSLICLVYLHENTLFNLHSSNQISDFEWSTIFGKARLIRRHQATTGLIENNVINRNRLCIEFSFEITERDSLYDLIDDFVDYLNDVEWILSFISKQQIRWYKFEMLYEPHDLEDLREIRHIVAFNDARDITGRMRRFEKDNFWENTALIVNPQQINLIPSIFEKFLFSPQKQIIIKVLEFIIPTYRNNYFIESDLIFLYTALEIIASESSEKLIISSSKFKRLEKAIKQFITEQDKVDLNEHELNLLNRKVPELKRLPYFSRLESIFEPILSDISTKLYQSRISQNIMDMLKHSLKRRNSFVHEGRTDDDTQILISDIALLRFLISIWILSTLEHPLQEINLQDSDLMTISRFSKNSED